MASSGELDPDLLLYLAAESHVDRSIDGHSAFIESNVTGTFKLLQAVRSQWESHPTERQSGFRMHHISPIRCSAPLGPPDGSRKPPPTPPAALFGQQSRQRSLGERLGPHLRHAGVTHQLFHKLQPLAVPEKLIPVVILRREITSKFLYGDGANVRGSGRATAAVGSPGLRGFAPARSRTVARAEGFSGPGPEP